MALKTQEGIPPPPLPGSPDGTATTGNSGGLQYPGETGGTTLADYSVVQNSLNIGELGLGVDVYAEGTYDFLLNAWDISNPLNKININSAWMQVTVSEVPEPATAVVWSLLGAFGMATSWRHRRNR